MSFTPRLKILIALQYYVPHRTGLTLHVQRLAEGLAARGHTVTVLTARYHHNLPRDEQVINGVRVIRLWSPLRISRGMVMPAYPLAAYKLIKMHDVVSIHTPMLETPLFALLCKLLGKPLTITHHGDLVLPRGWLNRLIERFVFSFYQMGAKVAYRIVGYSHDYADHSYYLRPFRDKTRIIYPPIEIPMPDASRVEDLRSQWSNGTGTSTGPLIGYAGRFVEEKRPDVLINTLPRIHQKYPGARIVFAGEYRLKYEDFFERNLELVERHKDHLVFLGLLTSAQDVADFYAAMDVLALPSDTECLGLVQAEAMLCGTPVVVTNIPGARETVRVTGMGEVVTPRDPDALAEGLLKVLDNRTTYVKPHAEIASAYSLEETLNRNEQLFVEAASS